MAERDRRLTHRTGRPAIRFAQDTLITGMLTTIAVAPVIMARAAEKTAVTPPKPTMAPPPLTMKESEYLIGAYDQLTITVFNNPELSGRFHVRPDGYMSIPLVADLRAADNTPTNWAWSLSNDSANSIFRSPVNSSPG